jgi:hypothetical protein|tara:strand:+ start:124 stop:432 length:309 start_codon:yes stop_codon:yes gene_type:complete
MEINMESYSTEMHYYKNIKTKRPSVGYKTEKERAYAQWSGVSDYEVYYKNELIGEVYKTTSYGGYWGYSNLDFSVKGHAHIKGEAVRELYEGWRDSQVTSDH